MTAPEGHVRESKAIRVEGPENGPPLILTANMRLSAAAIANLRRSWEEAWRGDYAGASPRILILDAGLRLHQLVDGQWREIPGAECSPLPSGGIDRPDDPSPEV